MTDRQGRLGDYGAGRTSAPTPSPGSDESGSETDDQCIAIADSTGERCENPVSRMGGDGRFCSPHAGASDVDTIDEVNDD